MLKRPDLELLLYPSLLPPCLQTFKPIGCGIFLEGLHAWTSDFLLVFQYSDKFFQIHSPLHVQYVQLHLWPAGPKIVLAMCVYLYENFYWPISGNETICKIFYTEKEKRISLPARYVTLVARVGGQRLTTCTTWHIVITFNSTMSFDPNNGLA